MSFRPIDASGFPLPGAQPSPGPAPQLMWIKIIDLVLDDGYQRDIAVAGRRNVLAIARAFDWSKFAPAIVAPVEGGRYAMVDGQHRTTAAFLCGIESVPCQVVQADRAQQAAAFVAINGNITKLRSTQIFHAALAAGDPGALAVQDVADRAEVIIVASNKAASEMKRGETTAVQAIRKAIDGFGRDTVITALQCVTQVGEGNPGLLRHQVIEAYCLVLGNNLAWRDAGGALFDALDDFDLGAAYQDAVLSQLTDKGTSVSVHLGMIITAHLVAALGAPAVAS